MMSLLEFRRLIRGEIVKNDTDQSKRYLSNAQGFCFNDSSAILYEEKPFHRLGRLRGIIPSIGAFVKMDIPENCVNRHIGEYRGFFYDVRVEERSTTKYGIPLGTTLIGYRFFYYPFCEIDVDPDEAFSDEIPVKLRPLQGTKNLIVARRELKKFSRDPEKYINEEYYWR